MGGRSPIGRSPAGRSPAGRASPEGRAPNAEPSRRRSAPMRPSGREPGGPVRPLGGCAGLARRSLSSSGARSNRRMIDCISSPFGASMKAKPLDSWVSGFRITLMESATRASAFNHDWMSSAVTQVGRLPRKTVKLIRGGVSLTGIVTKVALGDCSRQAVSIVAPKTKGHNEDTEILPKTHEKQLNSGVFASAMRRSR